MQENNDKPISFLDKIIVKISEVSSYIFIFIVVISFYEILMRYIFNLPTIWVHESAAFLGGILFVLGGSYALAINKHVRVVLIYDMVPKKIKIFLNIFHHIMGMLFSLLMIYASWNMTREAWLNPSGEISLQTSGSAWDMPLPALLKAVILIVSLIIFIQFLVHLILDVKKIGKSSV